MSDFVGDFLTRIRNAQMVRQERLVTRASRLTVAIAEILKKEGYIENYKVVEENKKRLIRVHLKYLRGRDPAVRQIRRISKPGYRQYVSVRKLPRVRSGLGMAILSTSRGVMTDREARKQRAGGELLCTVW